MGKIPPEERWKKHIMERFTALEQSRELKKLRAEGLVILKRKELFTAEEWWQTFSQRAYSPQYRAWHERCKTLGERFGLAPWTVEMACLLKGYRPEEQPHVMEAVWPKVRVVTESTDPLFLTRLAYEAQRLGLYVVQCRGSVETTCLYAHSAFIADVEPPPMPPSKPPLHSAFKIRVETPIMYPPEAANNLQKEAGQLFKELLRRLGYSFPQRLRNSRLVAMADQLRVADSQLRPGEIYDIIDATYGEEDWSSKDRQRRSTTKVRRHRMKKRLIKPRESET